MIAIKAKNKSDVKTEIGKMRSRALRKLDGKGRGLRGKKNRYAMAENSI